MLLSSMFAQAQQTQQYSRFEYHQYHWRAFHTSSFHIYFPQGYDSLCAAVADEMTPAMALVSSRMGTIAQQQPNIILYPSPDQLYESGIGSFEPGDKTLPTFVAKGNRILLAYKGSHTDLKAQLYEALVRAGWETRLSDGIEAQATGTTTHKVPYWVSEGSIRYFAHGWRIADEDATLRYLNDVQPSSWDQFIAEQPALAGQALCYFLSVKYFEGAPKQLFFLLQKRKPLPRALRLITKTELAELFAECLQFYKERNDQEKKILPDSTALPIDINLPHPKGRILKVLANEQVNMLAYVLATWHKRTVCLYNTATQKTIQLTSYALPPWIGDHSSDPYPLLSWAAKGNELLVTMPIKGKITVQRYYKYGGLMSKETLPGIDGAGSVLDHANNQFLLGAWRQGQSDIVSYDYRRDKYTPITNDPYDDEQPAKSGPDILFVSKRPLTREKEDTVLYSGIFSTRGKSIIPVAVDTIAYAGWSNPSQATMVSGINGRQQYALRSAYSSPTDHGNFQYGPSSLQTQYLHNDTRDEILSWRSTKDSIFILRQDAPPLFNASGASSPSPWLIDYRKAAAKRAQEDSILKAAANTEPSFLDGVFNSAAAKAKSQQQKDSIRKALHYTPSKSAPYMLQLYSAYFTAKVNNDYLFNRYQPYQSYQGQFQFPSIGAMAQGGFSDLFEHHHINVAFRLPAGTEGSDFYVKYRNTAKLLNWGLAYYRKSEQLQPDPNRNWVDENGRQYPNTARAKTNYYELSFDYPLSYFSKLELTVAGRQDKTVFQATEKYSLDFPAFKSVWGLATISYQYEKLQPTLPLLFKGFSGRIAVDAFKGFTQAQKALAGLSMKAVYHLPLYKYITLVAQLQAGYSAGDHRVLYNLGGIDNNITPRTDTSVHFAQDAPYAFQTLVTPLRGFYQNSVYGSQYALMNVDVYFPIFQTLIPVETPLSFINNLQLGLFTDVASAGGKAIYSTKDKGWQTASGFSARTTLAGYPLRFDMGWPGAGGKPVWYLSLLKPL